MPAGLFNNNVKNERTIRADKIYLEGGQKGQVITADTNGELIWSTEQVISTLPFLNGVTEDEIARGHTWLKNAGKDEALTLQSLISDTNGELTALGLDANAPRTFIIETPTGFIFFDEFITIPDNTSIEFRCYVVAGRTFRLQCAGAYDENPPNITTAPIITSNITEGTMSFTCDAANYPSISTWNVGDLIALRSTSLNKRQDNEIATITNTSGTIWTITLAEPANDDFDIDANDGTVRQYDFYRLVTGRVRGDCKLFATGSFTNIDQGTYISIVDKRMAGEFASSASNVINPTTGSRFWYSNNPFKHEQRMVLRVDPLSFLIELDTPLSNDYDTTNTYVLVMKPRENIKIKGMRIFYIEQPSYPRPNNHAVLLDACVNCEVEDITFSDSFTELGSNIPMYPNMDNVVRVRESYGCHVKGVNINRARNDYTDSGAGYGVTSYYNSYCTFQDIFANTLRHNILLQGCDHCQFTNITLRNPLISGFDMHGLNERDNNITNLYIDCSAGQGALLSNNTPANSSIGMIRLGNSTHPTGASFNTFNGGVLKYGVTGSNITSVYGIEIVPRSEGNIFKNFVVENVDKAIAMYDHPRGRLNSNLLTSSNIFDSFTIKNCGQTIDVNGADAGSNAFSYLSTTATSATANTVRLASTANITKFDNIFNGWVLQHSTSNYTVSNYTSSNREVLITGTFAPSVTAGDTLILKDSLTATIRPIRDIALTNSYIVNNTKCCSFKSCMDPRLINNHFGQSTDTTGRYIADLQNVQDASIIKNTTEDCRRFVQLSNTSNVRIINNHTISQVETNVISDLAGNSNVMWNHNFFSGFSPTWATDSSTTWVTDIARFGYNKVPGQPLLVVDNSNGFIGIGKSNPEVPLHIRGTVSLPMIIESTSANSAQIALVNSNTTSSNHVQIKGSNDYLILRGSNSDTVWVGNGSRVGIAKAPGTSARVSIYQTGSTPFISFDNSNVIATGSNINTDALGTFYGRVRVNIEGVGNKWLALYN